MKNFRTLLLLALIMAILALAFGITMYRAVDSSKFYGTQPSDPVTLAVALIVFSACVSLSAVMLGRALDWLTWCAQFQKEFGFKAPNDPGAPLGRIMADQRAIEVTLNSVYRQHPEKYTEIALLAERFGFLVEWPAAMQKEVGCHRRFLAQR